MSDGWVGNDSAADATHLSDFVDAMLAKARNPMPIGELCQVRDVPVSEQHDIDTVRKPSMVVEGDEALDLYVRQISRNLTELEKQVELLRQACFETAQALREVE